MSDEATKDDEPKDDEPKDDEPKDDEPKDDEPKDDEPKDDEPKDDEPKDDDGSKDDEAKDDNTDAKVDDTDSDPKKVNDNKPKVVTRYEIFDIIEGKDIDGIPKYDRLLKALKKMLEGDNGTSPFFRLASYHGRPGPGLCAHGIETFPGWHRIYLMEFEKELQKCDIMNGNDGNIGLPYWDWSSDAKAKKGLPKIAKDLYKEYGDTFPPKFFPGDFKPGSMTLKRPSNKYVRQRLKSKRFGSDAPGQVEHILTEPFHWKFACSQDRDGTGLEDEHGSLHMIVSGEGRGVMGSLSYAAYDVMFWLHHCNVDRIYERYLDIDKDGNMKSNSKSEFEYAQNYFVKEYGYENNFDAPFPTYEMIQGFSDDGYIVARDWNDKHDDALRDLPYWKRDPNKGTEKDNLYYPKDTFDTKALGFVYFDLPMMNRELVETQLRTEPTFVIFPNVKESKLQSSEYTILVYLVDKNDKDSFVEPKTLKDVYGTDNDDDKEDDGKDDDEPANKNYAGFYFFFGRSDFDCENCSKKPPRNIRIDVTNCLERLKLSRHDAEINIYIYDGATDNDDLITLSDTNLPEPHIGGPLFENNDETLDEGNKIGGTNNENEVKSLQKYLKRFGYYDGKIDGKYGKITTQAINDYQKSIGIEVTGIADPATKKSIVTAKRCVNVDPFAENKVSDNHVDKVNKDEKTITYCVGVCPEPDLKRDDVLDCIDKAFKQWANVCGLEFKRIDDKSKCDINIYWKRETKLNDVLKFDGPGGVLGHGGKGFVMFDAHEKWLIGISDDDKKTLSKIGDYKTYYKGRQPYISLYSVATHEIGHALGIPHLSGKHNVMSPYYQPTIDGLKDDDINYAKKLYGKDVVNDDDSKTDDKTDDKKDNKNDDKKEEPKKEKKTKKKKGDKKKGDKKDGNKNGDTMSSVWKEIAKKKNNPINWYASRIKGKKSNELIVDGKGNGGINELRKYLSKNERKKQIRFVILRVNSLDNFGSVRAKFIFFKFLGSKVNKMTKAGLISKMSDIELNFKVRHLIIDLDESLARLEVDRLAKEFLRVGGAHKPDRYDFGGKVIYKCK